MRQRTAELAAIDFSGAPGHEVVEGLLSGMEVRMMTDQGAKPAKALLDRAQHLGPLVGHVHRDRSGPDGERPANPEVHRVRAAKGYEPERSELPSDVFGAEFTHEGELPTFEVLVQRFGLDEPALRTVAENVHDIGVKEAKYGREEAPASSGA